MKKDKALVSVILPTYNRAYIIKEAITSVINQSYKNWELIVVDDGSTDNTKDLVQTIADSRLKYIRTDNQGSNAARNLGIELSKGEYVAFQDSDDIWLEHKLEKQMELIEKKKVDLVISAMYIETSNKKVRLFPKGEKSGLKGYTQLLARSIASTQTFCGKRKCFIETKFDITMPRMQDWDIVLRISEKFKVYFDKEPLVNVRLQTNSLTGQKDKGLIAYEKIYKRHIRAIKGDENIKGLHVLLKGHLIKEAGGVAKDFYKENLCIKAKYTIRARILGKYLMSRLNLLDMFYKYKQD